MRISAIAVVFAWCAAFAATANFAEAQQIHTGGPLRGVGHSFHENIGVGFGMSFNAPSAIPPGRSGVVGFAPGMGAGGPVQLNVNNGANPAFGGFAPGQGANAGFGIVGGGMSGFFNIHAAQGSSTTNAMTSPSVTTMNGYPGAFFSGSQRPFVIGVIPVVGGGPVVPIMGGMLPTAEDGAAYFQNGGAGSISPVRMAAERLAYEGSPPPRPASAAQAAQFSPADLQLDDDGITRQLQRSQSESSAGRGAQSLAAIRAQHAVEDARAQEEIHALIAQGDAARAAKKWSVARQYYQMALRRAGDEALRQTIEQRLGELARESGSASR